MVQASGICDGSGRLVSYLGCAAGLGFDEATDAGDELVLVLRGYSHQLWQVAQDNVSVGDVLAAGEGVGKVSAG